MELLKKTNIDFIGMRKISFIVSGIMTIIGLVAMVQIWRGEANLGIDFSGGTSIQLKFAQPVHMDQARAALARNNLKEANLQDIKEGNKLLVKVGKTTLASGKASDTIQEVFKKEFASNPF